MKRILGIALALAVMLSMLVATPVSAVSEGTVEVHFVPECTNIAGQNATYAVIFHNRELLLGGDYIDIDFPQGTGFAALADVTVTAHTTLARARAGTVDVAINTSYLDPVAPGRTIRVTVDTGNQIIKSWWVRVEIEELTNPASCDYFLQVGTSNVTPVNSSPYTIFTAKVDLVPGKNLVSLPAYPADPSIEVVLAKLFAQPAPFEFSVWYWDSWEQRWIVYASDTSFDELTELHAGKAYWIKVSHPVMFKFKGIPYPECQGPPQKWDYPKSWNMVGPAIQELDIWASLYLFDTMLPWPSYNTYAVSTIIGWNPTTQAFFNTGWRPGQRNDATWQQVAQGMHGVYNDYELQQMAGYFMSFLDEAQIIPPVY